MRNVFAWSAFFVALMLAMIVFSSEEEDARSAGCLPQASVMPPSSVCASCHEDSQIRWLSNQYRACTKYCMNCHKKPEMGRHHIVGRTLPKAPNDAMPLTSEMKVACTTCHNMSQPRYGSDRWKAASMFDRLFHDESRYKTYFLAQRNDQGQLCLSCH